MKRSVRIVCTVMALLMLLGTFASIFYSCAG